jgi:hypothetical protein
MFSRSPKGVEQFMDEEPGRGKTNLKTALKVLTWILVLLGGFWALSIFFDGVNHHVDSGHLRDGLLGVLALCVCLIGIVALVTWDHDDRSTLLVIAGVILVIGGLSAWSQHKSVHRNDQLVDWYCGYGSTSIYQLRGCVDHTNAAVVQDLDTTAAHFALGSGGCGAGSGPHCPDAKGARDAQQALDDYNSSGGY